MKRGIGAMVHRPARGAYAIDGVVLAFTRKDFTDACWPAMRNQLLDNVRAIYDDVLSQVEKDIRNKK